MSTGALIGNAEDAIDPNFLTFKKGVEYALLFASVFTLLFKLSTFDGSTTR
jgi:hypothetical protein